MRHAWEDFWLFVILALTLCAVAYDKACRTVTGLWRSLAKTKTKTTVIVHRIGRGGIEW